MAQATDRTRLRFLVSLCLLGALWCCGVLVDGRQRAALQRGETTRLEEMVAALAVPWQQTLVNAAALLGLRARGAARQAASADETRPDVARLMNENAVLREQARENERLRKLLGLRSPPQFRRVAASVVGREGWPWASALVIDKGRAQGVRSKCAVIAAGRRGEGLLGQVISARRGSAVVLPLLESGSGAAALVERSRQTGIVEGMAGGRCALRYLAGGADVRPGDKVLSSGQGTVFPKGLPIGTVAGVRLESETGLKAADLQPAVDPSLIEEVIVLIPGETR